MFDQITTALTKSKATRSKGKLGTPDGARCVMGVICEKVLKLKGTVSKDLFEDDYLMFGDSGVGSLSKAQVKSLGFADDLGTFKEPMLIGKTKYKSLADASDKGRSFKDIASALKVYGEANLCYTPEKIEPNDRIDVVGVGVVKQAEKDKKRRQKIRANTQANKLKQSAAKTMEKIEKSAMPDDLKAFINPNRSKEVQTDAA